MEKRKRSQASPSPSFPKSDPQGASQGNQVIPLALGSKWMMAHKVKVEQIETRFLIRPVSGGFQLEEDWVRGPERIVFKAGRRQVFFTEAEARREMEWWAEKERLEHEAKAHAASKAEAIFASPVTPAGLQRQLNYTIFRRNYAETIKALESKASSDAIREALDRDMIRIFGRTLTHSSAQLKALAKAMRRKPKKNPLLEILAENYASRGWGRLTLGGVAKAIKDMTGKAYPEKTISSALGVLQVHHRVKGRPPKS